MTTQKAPPRQPKMTLASIRGSNRPAPDRILLVGTEGVGKSSWGAASPNPIFIAAEDGIRHLNVQTFPEPESYDDVLEAVRTLATSDHDFKTLVIDTVDWLEPLVWEALCRRNGWANIEAPGFGKGYVAATEEWRKLILELDRLRTAKGMEIILLAHSTLRTIPNPSGPDYARFECKLHKGAAALLKEWTDVNLFAIHEEFVTKEGGKAKARVTGNRIVHTERASGWDAKNRLSLPPVLPLDYAEYAAAREAGRVASPENLLADAEALVKEWSPSPDEKAKVDGIIEAAKGDAGKLAKIIDRLRFKVAEKEETK